MHLFCVGSLIWIWWNQSQTENQIITEQKADSEESQTDSYIPHSISKWLILTQSMFHNNIIRASGTLIELTYWAIVMHDSSYAHVATYFNNFFSLIDKFWDYLFLPSSDTVPIYFVKLWRKFH